MHKALSLWHTEALVVPVCLPVWSSCRSLTLLQSSGGLRGKTSPQWRVSALSTAQQVSSRSLPQVLLPKYGLQVTACPVSGAGTAPCVAGCVLQDCF